MRTICKALLACSLTIAAATGCTTPAQTPANLSGPIARGETRPPKDFALAVTVFSEPAGGTQSSWTQPARFVIQPDGVLRAARGRGVSLDLLPPRTRVLSEPQIADLYTKIIRSGLDRGVGGKPVSWTTPPSIEQGESLIVIEVTSHDTRRVHVYDSKKMVQASALVHTLRRFARLER